MPATAPRPDALPATVDTVRRHVEAAEALLRRECCDVAAMTAALAERAEHLGEWRKHLPPGLAEEARQLAVMARDSAARMASHIERAAR